LKYAILFGFAGASLSVLAVLRGGYFLILLWLALSFVAIGFAYSGSGPRVFGKRKNGTMAIGSLLILMPYLAYLWCVWHVLRIVLREDCQNQVSDTLTIGRRLLASELPDHVEVVVDLTCEFPEQKLIRTLYDYQSFPMLDGIAPAPQTVVCIVRELARLNGHIYIHCAQGHGRTGLVAAALLLAKDAAKNPAAAIETLASVRPRVRLSKDQTYCLERAFQLMNEKAKISPPFTSPTPSSQA
jgi:protein-tyrosine phosphatase